MVLVYGCSIWYYSSITKNPLWNPYKDLSGTGHLFAGAQTALIKIVPIFQFNFNIFFNQLISFRDIAFTIKEHYFFL